MVLIVKIIYNFCPKHAYNQFTVTTQNNSFVHCKYYIQVTYKAATSNRILGTRKLHANQNSQTYERNLW